jgi:hypothetical protein
MSRSCEASMIRVLHQILTGVRHDHPVAIAIALWMGERTDIFGAVPQPWDLSEVDATIWHALSQIVERKRRETTGTTTGPTLRHSAYPADIGLTAKEASLLTFMVDCTQCDELAGLIAILSDTVGIGLQHVMAICVGVTEQELDVLLTGRLARAGLIKGGALSPALLRAISD